MLRVMGHFETDSKAKDYSGDDYYRKSGKQVRAVAAMINELLLEEIFETPAA